jgi:two-component system, NtrC family, nitrogen regulation sensor histidine kinase GlnL
MKRAVLRSVLGRRRVMPPIDPGAILGTLPVAVVALDAADRFAFVNHAAEQFFVASAPQLAGIGLADFVPVESALFQMIVQVRREGVTIAGHDLALESPRLSKRCVNAQVAPLPDLVGGVVLGLEDASVAHAFDRGMSFSPAARGVAGMAAVLAHEVKNPLSGIRGAAQLLEATLEPADRELAVLIRDEADRIRTLIDRMEMFGEEPVRRGAVNIHRVLEHVRRLAKSGFAQHIRLAETYDPSLPPAFGNRDQLVQVLLNLVKNAAEAINDAGGVGGEIVLSTAFQQGVWLAASAATSGPGEAPRPSEAHQRRHLPLVVAVRDNGPGISDALRAHLFEPFVSTKPAGSGLGLALVAKIVGEHGGLIDVDSRPGRTEFRLHLPVLTDGDLAQWETTQGETTQGDLT